MNNNLNNWQASPGNVPLNGGLPADDQKNILWRAAPEKLRQIDDGQVVKQLKYLRDNFKETSPAEIHMLLDPAEIGDAVEVQFSKSARNIESIRNIFLFLPLMITWLSFGMASAAFAQSADVNNKITGQSFFGLWVNGFPDISFLTIGQMHIPLLVSQWRWFTFGDIALTDFILLSFVVFLNQLAHIMENHARRDAMDLRAWLREEVKRLCSESLVRSIGTGPESEQPKWAVQVHTAINSLTTILKGVEDATKKSQKGFSETIDKFADSYQQQNKSVEDLIQNAREIEAAITHLHTVYQSSRDIYVRLEEILPRMGSQFDKMAVQQENATRAQLSIANNIQTASEAIHQLARPFATVGLAQMAQQATAQQQANLDLLQQMEQRLNKHVQNMKAGESPRSGFASKFFRRFRR